MAAPTKVRGVSEYLHVKQRPSSVATYSNIFGLFLKDDHNTDVQAVVLNSNNAQSIDEGERHKPEGDLFDIRSYCDASNSPNHPSCKVLERVTLKSCSDICALFDSNPPGTIMVHVGQKDSFSRLRISRLCFEQLMQSCDIFPALKDSILHLGQREMEAEIAPPYPRYRLLSSDNEQQFKSNGFEITYGLRFIEPSLRPESKPWSLRQFVVYNKTAGDRDNSRWVLFSVPGSIRSQIDSILQDSRQATKLHSLDIHILFLTGTIGMWRPYFVYLTQEVEQNRLKISLTEIDSQASIKLMGGTMLIVLKNLEVDLLDTKLALRATKTTLSAFRSFLMCISNSSASTDCHLGKACQNVVTRVISDLTRETSLMEEQARVLLQKVKSMSTTVASLLSLANGYSLESLATQGHTENVEMAKLTRIASQDTKAVKALSVITLIYLPSTVVLNFFSTTFVSTHGGTLQLLDKWWMLLAISIPLTVLTLFGWFIWATCRGPMPGAIGEQKGVDQTSCLKGNGDSSPKCRAISMCMV